MSAGQNYSSSIKTGDLNKKELQKRRNKLFKPKFQNINLTNPSQHYIQNFKHLDQIQEGINLSIKNLDSSLNFQHKFLKYKNGFLFQKDINLILAKQIKHLIGGDIEIVEQGFNLWRDKMRRYDSKGKITQKLKNQGQNQVYNSLGIYKKIINNRSVELEEQQIYKKRRDQILIKNLKINYLTERKHKLTRSNNHTQNSYNQYKNYKINNYRLEYTQTPIGIIQKNHSLLNYRYNTQKNQEKSPKITPLKLSSPKSMQFSSLDSSKQRNLLVRKSFKSEKKPKQFCKIQYEGQIIYYHPLSSKQIYQTLLRQSWQIISIWLPPVSIPHLFGFMSIMFTPGQYGIYKCLIKKFIFPKKYLNTRLFNCIIDWLSIEFTFLEQIILFTNHKFYESYFKKLGWKIERAMSKQKLRIVFKRILL